MATCSFIREKKQTAGAMGGVLRYVAQEQKTEDTDGTRYHPHLCQKHRK